MRVQVITIPHVHEDRPFDQYHGELLIQVLDGSGLLKTVNSEITMHVGDQALLMNGEGFSLRPTVESAHVKAQFVCAPGMNPCKTCWEEHEKFFAKERKPDQAGK